MPIENKSHKVNEPLFLGKSWDCVQMGVINPLFPRRAGVDPSLVSPAGTSGRAGRQSRQAVTRVLVM